MIYKYAAPLALSGGTKAQKYGGLPVGCIADFQIREV
jgi:hypothetical protein